MKVSRIVFGGIALVLVAACLLQLRSAGRTLPGKGVHLASVLPANVAGWTSRPVALGETEAVSGAVEQTLRFDDVFYREYRDASGRAVQLYVAYWNPGKMPVQLVASHVPDRCWTSAGWDCTEQNHDQVLSVGASTLRAGQGRTFRHRGGTVQHVVYWQLVGDDLFNFGQRFNRVPSPWRWWREVARGAVSRPQEQYFVRLSCDRPFEELRGDPGFGQILDALAELGLRAR